MRHLRPTPPFRVFIGWDVAQIIAWNVASLSLRALASVPVDVHRLALPHLKAQGLYRRPTGFHDDQYWDEISQAPMSTGHAIARFLVPALCNYEGWALFCDGDVLFRADVAQLFALADEQFAIQVVKHQYEPTETLKMTGVEQTRYARKNWSSVTLFHCGHPANLALTVDLVNTVPGRDLHRFCWLADELIGTLPKRWNALVDTPDMYPDPALAHFTEGTPNMAGYEHCSFADEWYRRAKSCGYNLRRPASEAIA